MKDHHLLPLVCPIFLLVFFGYSNVTDVFAHSVDDPNRWLAPHEIAERINPVDKTLESILRGKNLYAKHCTLCHGTDARGDGPAANTLRQKPTDLTSTAGMHEDGDVAWKIAEGRGLMPGWKERLSETQIWDLVNFIQSLKDTVTEQNTLDEKKH